ncbi:sensor histidine kinase [Streptomyces sp. P1-3]|uniref:sensor histidine kinase n=1 Tax=Streptomyces sp. P1-3 TaxID=3421658 RepID=UPI003D36ABB0
MLGQRSRRRWIHLVLGGALLMPYFLLTSVLIASLVRGTDPFRSLLWQFIAYLTALPLAAATALFPLARPLSATAARSLCGLPDDAELAAEPAASWDARTRTAQWFALHLGVGGLVSGATLALYPFAVYLMLLPVTGAPGDGDPGWVEAVGRHASLGPVLGAAVATLVVLATAAAGALLARCAPLLLGPAPADRLAAAEARAAALASRNRLARELHDSVGHALSAVSLQASAARRVLDADPEFARQALTAIEETTRAAVGELDSVLGLLRVDGEGSPERTATPTPTLADLDGLLSRTRAAGVGVEVSRSGALDRLPPVVSREAYRIVQEGLSNALRHAGRVRVRLRIAVPRKEELEIEMENPVREAARGRRSGGGRGLRGIAERAALLRGSSDWGAHGGTWRLVVRIPLSTEGPR